MPARKPTTGPEGSPVVDWLESPYLTRIGARIAHQYGLRSDELTELIQELRIAVWQAGAGTRVNPAWLFRVAQHKAVDVVRSRARERRHESSLAATAAARPEHDWELDYLLHARAQEMPQRLREFYEMHYRLGLSEREIAKSLGLCRSSVRWLDRCCRRYVNGANHGKAGPR